MCGIAGSLSLKGHRDDRSIMPRMLAPLFQRGPDAEGVYHNQYITLGHRRLRILDLSTRGDQPFKSVCGRYVMVFNGEIYNFRDIAVELGLQSSDLHTACDTEILMAAWCQWGEQTLDKLVGQFAFAVYDTALKHLTIARDRFGEKPLFYFYEQQQQLLVFASTLSSLLGHPLCGRQLDPDSIYELATLRYVVAPRTILKGVYKLQPGHLLAADATGIQTKKWYQLHFQDSPSMKPQDQWIEEFDWVFQQAVKRCLMSDVPVALLLSDGIDSQSIAQVLKSQQVHIPSITYEAHHDRSHLGARHQSENQVNLLLQVSSQERVRKMWDAFGSLSEPVGDGAALATWFLIRNAKDRATVFLCGHGADEILGGYRLSQERFRLQVLRMLAWLPLNLARGAIARFSFGDESLAFKQQSLRNATAASIPQATRYLIHRPLPIEDLKQLFGKPMDSNRPYLDSIKRLYSQIKGGSDLNSMQTVMIQTFLSENILSFADSVAMDSSCELRMPFLDRDLVQFVTSLPAYARVSPYPGRKNTKQILRWWAQGRLNQDVIKRPKSTFPFGSLRPLLREHQTVLRDYMLGSAGLRETIPGIENWLSHPNDYFRNCYQGTLWAFLALGIWCQKNGI